MAVDHYTEGYYERGEGSNYFNYNDDPHWRQVVQVIDEFVDGPQRIVEAGAAKGWFVHHARLAGHDAVGYDLSAYAVSHPAPEAQGFLFRHDATQKFPEEDGSADIVCAWEFFEHVEEQDVDTVILNLMRMVKPGGALWLKIGVSDPPFDGESHDHDATHFTMRPRVWWRWRLDQAGLVRQPDEEAALDSMFKDIDWYGRFFVYRKPVPTLKVW